MPPRPGGEGGGGGAAQGQSDSCSDSIKAADSHCPADALLLAHWLMVWWARCVRYTLPSSSSGQWPPPPSTHPPTLYRPLSTAQLCRCSLPLLLPSAAGAAAGAAGCPPPPPAPARTCLCTQGLQVAMYCLQAGVAAAAARTASRSSRSWGGGMVKGRQGGEGWGGGGEEQQQGAAYGRVLVSRRTGSSGSSEWATLASQRSKQTSGQPYQFSTGQRAAVPCTPPLLPVCPAEPRPPAPSCPSPHPPHLVVVEVGHGVQLRASVTCEHAAGAAGH
jgi:hypothetical protein